MKYGVILETASDGSVGAFLPDLVGVAVVGSDRIEALQLLRQAVRWHVEGLIEDAQPLPQPSESRFDDYVDVERTFVFHAIDDRVRDLFFDTPLDAAPQLSVEKRIPTIRVNLPVRA